MNRRELKKHNETLEKQIAPANEDIYTDLILYLRTSGLSEYNIESVRGDLAAMVIDAQTRGESIETLFGPDYRAFCDEIVAALPQKTKREQLIEWTSILFHTMGILWFILVLQQAASDFGRFRKLTGFAFTVGHLVSMILIIGAAIAIVYAVSRGAFRERKTSPKAMTWKLGIGFFLLMLAILLPTFLLRGVLFTISYVWALIILAGLLLVGYITERMY